MNKPKLNNGFIQIATGSEENDIILALAKAGLYSTEFEVVLVVIRKTWGWKKNWDWISISTFQKLTKKSRPMVIQALNDLVVKHILLVNKENKNKPKYCFNERFIEWSSKSELTSKAEFTTLVKQSLPKVVKQSIPTKEKKDTIQKIEQANQWLEFYNKTRNENRKSIKSWYSNFLFWSETYTLEEMKLALSKAQYDKFFDKVMNPDFFFRTKNKNGKCDYIGDLLNFKTEEYKKLSSIKIKE